MFYPLLFIPIHKKMVWGYESWDISCRPFEMSIVENGPLAGSAFGDLIKKSPNEYLGTKTSKFPLLVKIIVAYDDLSVQVHPDDEYAAAHGFESGKNEMWYVLETPGKLIIGLKDGATPKKLIDNTMSCLNELHVKPGDFIDIKAGLVHAIIGGTVVAEIQQNSDVTFRLYDYERFGIDGKPRELHVEHGLAVADFAGRIPKSVCESVETEFFNVTKLVVQGDVFGSTNSETFTIYTCVEGSCFVDNVELTFRRSIFLPSGLGDYCIKGNAVLLKTTL